MNHHNRFKGESIGHSCNGHPQVCLVDALHCQVFHLCQHNAPGNTPLVTVYLQGYKNIISVNEIAAAIRAIISAVGPEVGFTEADVSTRSLRAGRVMSLLFVRV